MSREKHEKVAMALAGLSLIIGIPYLHPLALIVMVVAYGIFFGTIGLKKQQPEETVRLSHH